MSKLFLRVEFETEVILQKIQEVHKKADALEIAVRELDEMCSTLKSETVNGCNH